MLFRYSLPKCHLRLLLVSSNKLLVLQIRRGTLNCEHDNVYVYMYIYIYRQHVTFRPRYSAIFRSYPSWRCTYKGNPCFSFKYNIKNTKHKTQIKFIGQEWHLDPFIKNGLKYFSPYFCCYISSYLLLNSGSVIPFKPVNLVTIVRSYVILHTVIFISYQLWFIFLLLH